MRLEIGEAGLPDPPRRTLWIPWRSSQVRPEISEAVGLPDPPRRTLWIPWRSSQERLEIGKAVGFPDPPWRTAPAKDKRAT